MFMCLYIFFLQIDIKLFQFLYYIYILTNTQSTHTHTYLSFSSSYSLTHSHTHTTSKEHRVHKTCYDYEGASDHIKANMNISLRAFKYLSNFWKIYCSAMFGPN
jgi:hypothetical protein